MKREYSFWSLFKHGLEHNEGWEPAWRSADPKPSYDFVIVGGGGHGLATAYYLAKEHGIRNVAVLEKGWIGGGNTAATRRSSARTTCGTRRPSSTRSR